MPKFGPIKRSDLVKYFKKLGFNGPYSGGKHQFMIKSNITIRIPNLHKADISKELLARLLKQAHINKHDWEEI